MATAQRDWADGAWLCLAAFAIFDDIARAADYRCRMLAAR
jgi:hypothetical protein